MIYLLSEYIEESEKSYLSSKYFYKKVLLPKKKHRILTFT